MAENITSGDSKQSSSQSSSPAAETPAFFVTGTGNESSSLDELQDESPPSSVQEQFAQASMEPEEPKEKVKPDADFDKVRQQFDQHAANLRRQNEELSERVEYQNSQLSEAIEKLKSSANEKPTETELEPLTADSDIEEMVKRLNQLTGNGNNGLTKQVEQLTKRFDEDKAERRQVAMSNERKSYLAEMEGFLAEGTKTYGDKFRGPVEQHVAAEMQKRGYSEKRLPDIYTLELAIKTAFFEVSGGKRRKGAASPPKTMTLDTGTGGGPTGDTELFQPQKLTEWVANKKASLGGR